MKYDFGFSQTNTIEDGAGNVTTTNEENTTALDGGNNGVSNLTTENNAEENKSEGEQKSSEEDSDNNDNNNNDSELEPGTSIEVEGVTYTVDEDGNVIDKDGNIFKEKKDVKAWLDEYDSNDGNNASEEISINNIRNVMGVDITDENDKPVEYENSVSGIKAYIDAVIESSKEEHFETAINTLYEKYPIIPEVLNYYIANGNSLEGFGQLPDRSAITIDDANEAQQEHIIRTAWKEQNRRGDIDSYINYLKSTGILASTAKEELSALQESDKQKREELANEAKRVEEENLKQLKEYWDSVDNVIKTRKLAGYEIPENISIVKNGKKLLVTPKDFFNYIYRVDDKGISQYQYDLQKQTPQSRMEDELLRAYLTFTGGSYSNLVDMAVNKNNVNKLILKAKTNKQNSIRITKPTKNDNKLDLGYN